MITLLTSSLPSPPFQDQLQKVLSKPPSVRLQMLKGIKYQLLKHSDLLKQNISYHSIPHKIPDTHPYKSCGSVSTNATECQANERLQSEIKILEKLIIQSKTFKAELEEEIDELKHEMQQMFKAELELNKELATADLSIKDKQTLIQKSAMRNKTTPFYMLF